VVARGVVSGFAAPPPDASRDSTQTAERGSSEVVLVQGFAKRYRKTLAVAGVDLSVRRGEIYGLIGPDGAGKSSLMKAIAGVLTFDAGEVEVFGVKLDSEAACERIKGRLGLMPQGLGQNLYADLSIEENIDFFARLRLVDEKDLAERKAKLLAMTRLDKFKSRPMKQLSGGMKQKLGLVCTLIHEPELIILDEPTTGVDPVSRRDFWAILAELLREKGITALVSTAYMDEASRFHRVALMFGGKILASGEPDEIQRLMPGSVVALRSADQVSALARLKAKFPQVEALGPWLKTFVDGSDVATAPAAVQAALGGLAFEDLYAAEPELEDVFIALLRSRQLVGAGVSRPAGAVPTGSRRKDGVAIEAMELTRDFGNFRAVDKVSFSVPQGEIFGLLGANGAGKTTAIKMLTGIIRPTAGAGRVAGADMRVAAQDIKERIGYMSQAFSLYMDLTVIENIHLYAGIYGLSAKEGKTRAEWVIGMAGLSGHETDSTASLPMGMRQRLALGCALVHRPQVLFLDEPTSGVDPVGRRQFWDILFSLSREEGVAILVTTHYMSEAEHCDHLALMYAGRIVADASPEQMKRDVEAEAGRLLEITADSPRLAMARLQDAGFDAPALFGKRIHLLSRSAEADAERIPRLLAAAGLPEATVSLRPLSMEDVFVYRVTSLEARERAGQVG
jgi:ABC-2 type transport system ATP-binding protein